MTANPTPAPENGKQETPNQEVPLALQAVSPPALSIGSEQELNQSLARTEKYFAMLDRINKLAIRMTKPQHWVDQSGTPYLVAAGCHAIAKGFGISVGEQQHEREDFTDEKGDYFIYKVSLSGNWNNHQVSQIGMCSTRDDFFCTKGGVPLPLSEIDVTNVQRKAFTNCLNRLIKTLLGLSFDWDEVEQFSEGKITKAKCAGVTYNSGSKGGNTQSAEGKVVAKQIGTMLMCLADGEIEGAKNKLAEYTTWTKKEDGVDKKIPGKKELKKCSDKQLNVIFPKVKKDYDAYIAEQNTNQQ